MSSGQIPRIDWKEFRVPRYYLWLGLIGTSFFVVFGTGSSITALLNIDGSFNYPVPTAVLFACFWGAWALLGIYILVGYFRERCYLCDIGLRRVGVFRSKTIWFAEITRVRWRGWPVGGSVVLYAPDTRLAISFAEYKNGAELAAILRSTLPLAIQESYERFETIAVITSQAFQSRLEREQRAGNIMLPVCGALLIGLAIWDP